MKGLKASATFVQLNGHHDNCHVINNHHLHHHRLSFVNISSSRHQPMIASTRRRRWHQSSLQSTADENNNNNSKDEINIIANDNANGIFLDLDTYLQAEETLLRPDGSLSDNISAPTTRNNNNEAYQSAMQGLFPPTYSYYPDTKNEQDLSDEELLRQSVTDIQNDKSAMAQQQQLMDAETLHQQVFAEEQVYLEQSEEFRKSLSNNLQTSSDDDYETPMAKGRREAVEEYNQGILSDLLREIEEMEANAISREDALSRAQTSGNFINNDDDDDDVMDVTSSAIEEEGSSSAGMRNTAFCSQCGLTVTPDMAQRAKYGPQKLLCQACYGIKFRIKDEADVRLPQGPTIWESNNRMWDQKAKKSNSRRRRLDASRMNRGSGLDTSSLFRIPDSRMPNEQMPDDVSETPLAREVDVSMRLDDSATVSRSDSRPPPTRNKPTPVKATKIVEDTKPASGGSSFRSKESNAKKQSSTSKVSMKQERRSTSSRLLGGRALERRKTQHKSDDVDATNLPGSHTGSIEKQQVDEDIIEEEAAPEQESSNEWIKVEDSTTKRIMYWNKQTGEMKRSID